MARKCFSSKIYLLFYIFYGFYQKYAQITLDTTHSGSKIWNF